MKISLRNTRALSLSLVLAFTVAGCSSAGSEDTYVPPGVELGDTVVNPPAPLPAALEQEVTQEEEIVLAACETPQALKPVTIELLNAPLSTIERKTASLTGELVVAAKEVPVQTIYQNTFSYLSQVTLDSGKTVWFGSTGSLNDDLILPGIKLDGSGEAAVFGATEETYSSFIWGSNAGPGSALVIEGEKVVEAYEHCFSSPSS